jgi:DNA-binding FadR family transcriptional regulator
MSRGEQPIQRPGGLPTIIARRLRASIADGRFEPGEQLPTQAVLGEMYGVSRSVIREAISLLKSDGLVISHQGLGQFVNPEGSSVFRLDADLGDGENLSELIEFLVSVESAAAGYAAQRRTDRDLAAINGALRALARAVDAREDGVSEDVAFHRAILKATHNEYFIDFGDFLENRVRGFIRKARTNTASQAESLMEEVQQEHEAIEAAIAAGNAEAAWLASQRHLLNAAQRLRIYLADQLT